jgi:hypothetical protein
LNKVGKEENGELPKELRERLDKLIDTPGRSGKLARVRLAPEVPFLFDRAPNWTSKSCFQFSIGQRRRMLSTPGPLGNIQSGLARPNYSVGSSNHSWKSSAAPTFLPKTCVFLATGSRPF